MMEEDLSGRRLHYYMIEQEVGRGGMARVYRARDTRLNRLCAIKVLLPIYAADEGYVRRFLREASSAARLDHPHIVPIYDVGEADDRYYISMRFYSGSTLEKLLREEQLDQQMVITYLAQAAEALDFAHQRNVIHRDVKPSNMIVDETGRLVITDFGIAAQLDDPSATSTGVLVGTPAYFTPEQIRGQPVSARTDVYQLGATAYELLSGVQPFADRPPQTILAAHLEETPQPVHERVPGINPAASAVISRAMAKEQADRYATATEFVDALRKAIEADEERAVPIAAAGTPVADPDATIVDTGPIPMQIDSTDTAALETATTETAQPRAKGTSRTPVLACAAVAAGALVLLIGVGSVVALLAIGGVFDEDDPTPTSPAALSTQTTTETIIAASPTSSPNDAITTPTERAAPTSTAQQPSNLTATRPPLPPTLTPIPGDVPTPSAGGLQVIQVGGGQKADDSEVGWSFIVENTDPNLVIEDSGYTILLKDANDVVIDSTTGFIAFVFPGETLGISGSVFLQEGLTASSIEVNVEDGEFVEMEDSGPFSISQISYFADEFFPVATGIVNNPSVKGFSDLTVYAVPYDAAGAIIGGGSSFMQILPPGGSAGAEVWVSTYEEPAYVEMYVTFSGFYESYEADSATDILVTNAGFGQDGLGVGWAAIIQNQIADELVEDSYYQVTLYDGESRVLATDWGDVPVLLGGQTLGIGNDYIYLPENTQAVTIQVDIITGDFSPDITGRFTVEDVQFVDDEFSDIVTGLVTNPFDRQLDDLLTTAIIYDENGSIIGSGSSFLDPLPAYGQTLATIYITGFGTVERIEIYVTPFDVSELQ